MNTESSMKVREAAELTQKTSTRCWLFHDWGKWAVYVRDYYFVVHATQKEYPMSETRQRRQCVRCGRTQDEFLRDGR